MNFAVAGGGRVSASFVARLPRLAVQLGPVAAQSYRLASRIVNSIGAGHPVRRYADLDGSSLILICAPASGVAAIVSALAEAVECRGKVILLCDAGAYSGHLAPLRSRGAAVGSIHVIPGFDGRRFVAEGDRLAVRDAKNLVRQIGGRVEEVESAKMATYSAGLSYGMSLFTPLMEASLQCFQEAGMTKVSALKVVEAVFQSSLRGYLYAGKRSWSGPLADNDLAAAQWELEGLAASNPLLAEHYKQAAALARRLLGGRGAS
jgi:predicted short-subunit dehydrogenase-like oxidoreductase (DUF2520 family)